ncbi:MAG: hypothetical protein WCF98_11135 [Synechococcus sp. ELA057]
MSPSQPSAEASEILLLEALDQDPGQIHLWNQLGALLQSSGRLGDAVQAHRQAAERDPLDVCSRTELGHLHRMMSFPEEAIHWYGEAVALDPRDLNLQLNHRIVLPIIPESNAQILNLRQRSIEGLDALLADRGEMRIGRHSMINQLKSMVYHNRDDRPVLERYGRLIQRHLPRNPQLENWIPSRRGRPRIGMLSGFFCGHSNALAFEGLIRNLDRSAFELIVIHLPTSKRDPVGERIDACADQTLTLCDNLNDLRHQLLALNLDLLFYPDIGMHPLPTLLACSRLAPVQATGWGFPQTTGLPCLDYYLSSDLLEPDHAQDHYSETLVRLPGLPCCYLSEDLPNLRRGRDYFFLPADVPLLGCLQDLQKLHPDFDPILEQIALRVPEALFVLIEAGISSHTQIYLNRVTETAPTFAKRLLLLSRMSREDYIALAAEMDLLLDPLHFSSGVTLYDTLHTGTPIVALEGGYLRSRVPAGAYRLIGLQDPPVVSTPEAYVEKVVALLADPEGLQALRQQIADLARRHLYDRVEVVRGFEAFAADAIEQAALHGVRQPPEAAEEVSRT